MMWITKINMNEAGQGYVEFTEKWLDKQCKQGLKSKKYKKENFKLSKF